MPTPDDGQALKVFISYSRRDTAIADALLEALTSHGFEVLIDRRSLPFGERWQAELAELIRKSAVPSSPHAGTSSDLDDSCNPA